LIRPEPVVLERGAVRLEPLGPEHVEGLKAAASDGELWRLWFTQVPRPEEAEAYVATALQARAEGRGLAFAVRDLASGAVVGCTRYHDVAPDIGRLEIGYTWYAKSRQRTALNTTCKLLLLGHAFDALGAGVVVLLTDAFNFTSQRAIEALGAKKDGVLRHHRLRRDGVARDSVVYSILAAEWPDVRRHLEFRLERHGPSPVAA
jgi:RimJ/RimL family protein N-acetyltransferase